MKKTAIIMLLMAIAIMLTACGNKKSVEATTVKPDNVETTTVEATTVKLDSAEATTVTDTICEVYIGLPSNWITVPTYTSYVESLKKPFVYDNETMDPIVFIGKEIPISCIKCEHYKGKHLYSNSTRLEEVGEYNRIEIDTFMLSYSEYITYFFETEEEVYYLTIVKK
ncbi:MAG: hypothetical protein J5507_06000 [Clostridia bacterium]|nr:hypothetical protein [Clostridia bacterium]